MTIISRQPEGGDVRAGEGRPDGAPPSRRPVGSRGFGPCPGRLRGDGAFSRRPRLCLFWLVGALAVHWEWQRLIGAPLPWIRMFAGWLALGLAVVLFGFDQQSWPSFSCCSPPAFAPGRRGGVSGCGPAPAWFTRAAFCCGVAAAPRAIFGLCAIAWLFAVVWGTDVCAYFGGRLIGGVSCARDFARQDLVRIRGRHRLRRGSRGRRHPFGAEFHLWPNVARIGPVFALGSCHRRGRAGRRSAGILDQAPFRRQGFQPPHPRPRRLHGSAGRFRRRRHIRRCFRLRAWPAGRRSRPVLLALGTQCPRKPRKN